MSLPRKVASYKTPPSVRVFPQRPGGDVGDYLQTTSVVVDVKGANCHQSFMLSFYPDFFEIIHVFTPSQIY